MKLGFSIRTETIDGVKIDYLSYSWICKGKHRLVEIVDDFWPGGVALSLRAMSDRIREIEQEKPCSPPTLSPS